MASPRKSRTSTTVLIVDDHRSFSESLGTAIDLQDDMRCAGCPQTVGEALDLLATQPVDVVLMDVNLPDVDGIEGTTRVKERFPHTRVVVMTAHTDLDVMARAAAAGASGFLPKESSIAEIFRAIRTANEGGMLIESATLTAVISKLEAERRRSERRSPFPPLTQREREALALMGEGLDPRGIAGRLGISLHTARSHGKSILAKLGAHSQLEAVVTAVRHGLLAPPRA